MRSLGIPALQGGEVQRSLTRLDRSRDAFYFTFWITEAELLAMFESP